MKELLIGIKSKALYFLLVFLAPIHSVMQTTVFLVMIDFIVGLWAAKKRGEAITSKKMSLSISKVLLYNVALITSYLVETIMIPEIPLVRVCAGFIAAVEVKSLFENINIITGLNLWDAVKNLFNRKTDEEKPTSSK